MEQSHIIISASLNDINAGYAIYHIGAQAFSISDFCVLPEVSVEITDIMHCLFETIENSCLKSGRSLIVVTAMRDDVSFASLSSFLMTTGYMPYKNFHIYRYHLEDCHRWSDFMSSRGNSVVNRLEGNGYKTVTFDETDDLVIKYLRDSRDNSFENEFNIADMLDDEKKIVSGKLSAVTLANGKPVAYVLLTEADSGSVVIEQLSVARSLRNTGVFLLPLVLFMRRFVELGVKRCSYIMSESNSVAFRLSDKILAKMMRSERVQHRFKKDLDVGDGKGEGEARV
jgi:hypothetical protein